MHLLSIIGGAGALQGAVVLVSILFRFRHKKNLPLALLLTVFSIRLATIPTWSEQILNRYPWVFPLTATLPVFFGPLLWWYIREVINKNASRPPGFIFHWIPGILLCIFLSGKTITMTGDQFSTEFNRIFSGQPPLWFNIQNLIKLIITVCYMILSFRLAFGNNSRTLSSQKRFWIRSIVIVPTVVFTFFCYVALNPAATAAASEGNTLPFKFLSISMLVFVYLIAFLFMFTPEFSMVKYTAVKNKNDTRFSETDMKSMMRDIEQVINRGFFYNPDATISDLAAELGIHPNTISYVINSCAGVSFRAFLNKRRIAFFCEKASSGYLQNHSILDLAFEAGFPSKSTFNRVFREYTGMNPSEYLKLQ